MFDLKDIKKLLFPVIKRYYLVLFFLFIAIYSVHRFVRYATPLYESTAKIKLDDQRFGSSGNSLYKDFDVFVATQKIEAEVELLRSQTILQKALDQANMNSICYRMGNIKKTELFDDNLPFLVYFELFDPNINSLIVDVEILSDTSFFFSFNYRNQQYTFKGDFDERIAYGPLSFGLKKTHFQTKGIDIKLIDKYQLVLFSKEGMISQIDMGALDIVAADKDIPVLRISYKSGTPQKSAIFVNALAKTYLDDYIEFKTQSATKTQRFIDFQLIHIQEELQKSENEIEVFKKKNNVVNIVQETETGLRQLSQQRIQLANLEMDANSLEELNDYIKKDEDLNEAAPHFGFGDLLFTEMIKVLKAAQNERRELLIKYTPDNRRVKAIDEKIKGAKQYLIEGIQSAKRDIYNKRNSIEHEVEVTSHQFDDYPELQKKLAILERNYRLHEMTYNFLMEKRTEASITSNANLSFHRIIQKAYPSNEPVSPNKKLLLFIGGFVGIFIGVVIAYIIEKWQGVIYDRESIELNSTIPVLGLIPFVEGNSSRDIENKLNAYATLVKNLQIKGKLFKGAVISVTSGINNEGKSFTAHNISNTLYSMGYNVLYLDANFSEKIDTKAGIIEILSKEIEIDDAIERRPYNYIYPGINSSHSNIVFTLENMSKQLDELKQVFDVIIIDSAAAVLSIDAITIMKLSDTVLYLFKINQTNSKFIQYADIVKEENKLDNLFWVLNGIKGSYSYQGHYNDKLFAKKNAIKRLLARL